MSMWNIGIAPSAQLSQSNANLRLGQHGPVPTPTESENLQAFGALFFFDAQELTVKSRE